MNVDQPHIGPRIVASEDMIERRLTDFVCSGMQPQFRPLFLHLVSMCIAYMYLRSSYLFFEYSLLRTPIPTSYPRSIALLMYVVVALWGRLMMTDPSAINRCLSTATSCESFDMESAHVLAVLSTRQPYGLQE